MILNTKYLENCKSALKPCGISGFPWWAPGRVKYYDDVDRRQNADIIIFHLILHAWSNRSEIYHGWRMKERTYLGSIEPGSATYQNLHDTIGVCSWSEALADLMNNCGQTQAPLGIWKDFMGIRPASEACSSDQPSPLHTRVSESPKFRLPVTHTQQRRSVAR